MYPCNFRLISLSVSTMQWATHYLCIEHAGGQTHDRAPGTSFHIHGRFSGWHARSWQVFVSGTKRQEHAPHTMQYRQCPYVPQICRAWLYPGDILNPEQFSQSAAQAQAQASVRRKHCACDTTDVECCVSKNDNSFSSICFLCHKAEVTIIMMMMET